MMVRRAHVDLSLFARPEHLLGSATEPNNRDVNVTHMNVNNRNAQVSNHSFVLNRTTYYRTCQ
jgi:hypothetical protein